VTRRIWVAISGHGFGHLAQTAPVINSLFQRLPDLRVTVQSPLPRSVLSVRIQVPFDHLPDLDDVGMVMVSAFQVDLPASVAAYRAQSADWPARLARQCDNLRKFGPDLVLSNISHLVIAAAACCGVPVVALCSLNWADILEGCLADREAPALTAPVRAAYQTADRFLTPTPSMPMPGLSNLEAIGPVAALGRNRRAEIIRRLALPDRQRLVMVTLGGMHGPLPMQDWPRTPGITWLVPSAWRLRHPDAVPWESLGLAFLDGLASCDAMLTKPGYGSFVEAACVGIPVLYVDRPDWPEAPALVAWLNAVGRAQQVLPEAVDSGRLTTILETLLSQPPKPTVDPSGVVQAVDCLTARLR
jgi:hypothetical protein